MATPNEKLADSLSVLQRLQNQGQRIFKSDALSRTHRERLIRQGFLRDVIKGWLMSTGPQVHSGDTTPWYASFWEFCDRYCHDRFGEDWFLSPEQSLLLHAEATVIPSQVVVNSPRATNNNLPLLFGTSIYDLKVKEMPPRDDLVEKSGLKVYAADAALVKVPDAFFQRSPIEAQIVLGAVRNVSGILGRLLDGGQSVVAGRLAGAFRHVGRVDFADDIVRTMKSAGYDVRETDPFVEQPHISPGVPGLAPIAARLKAIWDSQRDCVLEVFPRSPERPPEKSTYMKFLEDIYQNDAYHSLSIEGYSVTPELIDRVRLGEWNPEIDEADRQSRDALAARGYWQAFQKVKASVAAILDGAPPGALVRQQHREWFRELFAPSMVAGLLKPSALAGYRNHSVYLRGSSHVPPRAEAVADGMDALFDLLETETEPAVRAVLGHWLVGYVHPYPDGNGRMARFLMNAMLASGGYFWTIVRVEDRAEYLAGLENASVNMDVRPFALFLSQQVRRSLQKGTA